MMSLTDLRAPSINSYDSTDDQNGIKLNSQQMKMIENTTKYASLLNMSVLSSKISLVMVGIIIYLFRNELCI